jgi:hypothetical protein
MSLTAASGSNVENISIVSVRVIANENGTGGTRACRCVRDSPASVHRRPSRKESGGPRSCDSEAVIPHYDALFTVCV